MESIYFDPRNPASFGSARELQRASGQDIFKVKDWLKEQNAYTLHKTVKRKFPRRKVIVGGIDHQWQCDLVDVARFKNKNTKFLLTVIDVFSKYAWVVPVKDKTNKTMIEAFSHILRTSQRKPFKLQSDHGTEFKGKPFQEFLSKHHIEWFATKNMDTKATIVERFNRSLMGRLARYMTHKGTNLFTPVLQTFVASYNNKVHSSTGFAPSKVDKFNSEEVWQNLYEKEKGTKSSLKEVAIPLHTPVRLVKEKKTFRKSYKQGWTDEVFYVAKVLRTRPITYVVKDFQDEIVEGTFYKQELQAVKPQLYLVEKILATRGRGKTKQHLIKWKGYPESANSWITASSVVDL